MQLSEIREILAGLRVPVEVKRQAWIEYGGRLAQCPERQGGKIGAWVREQGLDFVTDTNERSAALRLFNFMVDHEVNLTDCPCETPSEVIRWLRNSGQIEVTRRQRSDATDTDATDAAPALVSDTFEALRTQLSNAATVFERGIDDSGAAGAGPFVIAEIADHPMGGPWGVCPSGKTVSLVYRVTVEAVISDAVADESSRRPVSGTRTSTTFEHAKRARLRDGITDGGAELIRGAEHD